MPEKLTQIIEKFCCCCCCCCCSNLDTSPSFIDELRALHVEPVAALKTAAVALMGLMAGVPMGPEAGLGAVAGAIGTLAGTRMRSFVQQPRDRARLYVASAMCSVFAALLPSPLAALLLTIELGRTPTKLPGLSVMHIITQLSLGATAAFAVYYASEWLLWWLLWCSCHPLAVGFTPCLCAVQSLPTLIWILGPPSCMRWLKSSTISFIL